jgi:hypothetical protein
LFLWGRGAVKKIFGMLEAFRYCRMTHGILTIPTHPHCQIPESKELQIQLFMQMEKEIQYRDMEISSNLNYLTLFYIQWEKHASP